MRSRLPSLREIEAFASAAETLSFRIAAERLHVTVSAISHRIHALEEEIGVSLFDRHGRTLRLTAAGVAYRDRVEPLLDALKEASEAVNCVTESPMVRVASFHMFHAYWLAPRLGRFLALYPEAQIELVTLRRRSASHPDITVRIIRPSDIGAEDELLFDWSVSPMCRPELVERYRLAEPADLARAPLIEIATAREDWARWFAAAGLSNAVPQCSIVVDSPSLNYDLIRNGVGVGLSADMLSETLYGDGLVQPFPVAYPYPRGVFVSRAQGAERPIVSAFRAWLTAEVAATVERPSTCRENTSLVIAG